jgi:hypothetical protein
MKKALLVVALLVVAGGLYVALKSPSKQTDASASANSTAAKAEGGDNKVTLTSPKLAEQPLTGFAASPVIAALRESLKSGDRPNFDPAFQALVDYINANPGNVEEFNGFMRTESDEQVLRFFTFALAASEVGLLENDEIIKTVTELAKTSTGFEQRQHIMLHLMSKFPDVRENVLQTVLDVAQNDPNAHVKTSGMVVLADWMEAHPDRTAEMLDHVRNIFNSSADQEVRAFGYQMLALHKESLPPEVHTQLAQTLRSEPDSFHGNLIAMALFAAPDSVRNDAIPYLQNAYQNETDAVIQRNRLLQWLMVSRGEDTEYLRRVAAGNSPAAEDAKVYLTHLQNTVRRDPQEWLQIYGERTADPNASCANHEHN